MVHHAQKAISGPGREKIKREDMKEDILVTLISKFEHWKNRCKRGEDPYIDNRYWNVFLTLLK